MIAQTSTWTRIRAPPQSAARAKLHGAPQTQSLPVSVPVTHAGPKLTAPYFFFHLLNPSAFPARLAYFSIYAARGRSGPGSKVRQKVPS